MLLGMVVGSGSDFEVECPSHSMEVPKAGYVRNGSMGTRYSCKFLLIRRSRSIWRCRYQLHEFKERN
jgi:hypothetical protein